MKGKAHMGYSYKAQYSALKRKGRLQGVATWMGLQDVMQMEPSQVEGQILQDCTYRRHLSRKTHGTVAARGGGWGK